MRKAGKKGEFNSLTLLPRNGSHRVILVTSAIHMTRAALLFRRAGIEFVPFPVDYQADNWEWKWDRFVPSSEALGHSERNVHETYGDFLYRIIPFAGTNTVAQK